MPQKKTAPLWPATIVAEEYNRYQTRNRSSGRWGRKGFKFGYWTTVDRVAACAAARKLFRDPLAVPLLDVLAA